MNDVSETVLIYHVIYFRNPISSKIDLVNRIDSMGVSVNPVPGIGIVSNPFDISANFHTVDDSNVVVVLGFFSIDRKIRKIKIFMNYFVSVFDVGDISIYQEVEVDIIRTSLNSIKTIQPNFVVWFQGIVSVAIPDRVVDPVGSIFHPDNHSL